MTSRARAFAQCFNATIHQQRVSNCGCVCACVCLQTRGERLHECESVCVNWGGGAPIKWRMTGSNYSNALHGRLKRKACAEVSAVSHYG